MKKLNIFLVLLILMSTIGFGCAAEGDILWSTGANIQDIMSTTIHPDGTIYCANHAGQIFSVDPLTGEETLQYTLAGEYVYFSNLALSPDGEVLYVPDEGTYKLYAFNTEDFSEKWSHQFGYLYTPTVVDAEGYLYVMDYVDGNVIHKINPEDGEIVWTHTPPNDEIAGSVVISADGSKLMYPFTDYGGYLEEITTDTHEMLFSTYHDPWDVQFTDYEDPLMAYDQNGELIIITNSDESDTTSIVRVAADGSLTKGGTDGHDCIGAADFNPVTFTDDYRIIAPQMGATHGAYTPLVAVYENDLTKIFDLDQSEIGATAVDDYDYVDCVGVVSEDNIYYTTITRGNPTAGADVYGTGIIAIDVDNQEVEWFLEESERNDYGATSMALMDNPRKQLICYGDDTHGLMAIEVSASPLWTRNDFENGDMGYLFEMSQNQFTLPVEEEVIEDDDDNDYGAYVAWKLSQEKEVVEEIVIEEVVEEEDDEGITSVMFELNDKEGNDWLIYLIIALGSYVGASAVCKYKETLKTNNVLICGTIGWFVPLMITLFVFDMFILNTLLGTTSLVVMFITFAIYGGICGAFSQE